ncbi:MAG TPA: DUF1634 domain-containing protein [Phycisphaerae bacterium]|nr:DUF1634 domain-containing protein [Phycisphaerae bacterium]
MNRLNGGIGTGSSRDGASIQVQNEPTIQSAAAWVLRTGVTLSALLMLIGLTLSFMHHPINVQRMQSIFFNYHPSAILASIVAGEGRGFIDLGIMVLAFTPVMRVAASMVIFAIVDRDWFYTLVTLGVLVMTLISLFLLS